MYNIYISGLFLLVLFLSPLISVQRLHKDFPYLQMNYTQQRSDENFVIEHVCITILCLFFSIFSTLFSVMRIEPRSYRILI